MMIHDWTGHLTLAVIQAGAAELGDEDVEEKLEGFVDEA